MTYLILDISAHAVTHSFHPRADRPNPYLYACLFFTVGGLQAFLGRVDNDNRRAA